MAKITEYKKIGAEFLSDPVKCIVLREKMPVDAATLFEALKAPESWLAMLPIERAEWHQPFGAKTTRTIGVKDTEVLEQFFEWEEGRSFAFRLERGTVAIFNAHAERYEVIEQPGGCSELKLTVRTQASGLTALFTPVLMSIFKWQARKALKKLAIHLTRKN